MVKAATKSKAKPKAKVKVKTGAPSAIDKLVYVGGSRLPATDAITRAIRNGASLTRAAELIGVPASTAKGWAQKGRDGNQEFEAFASDVETARAEARVRMAQVVFDAGHKKGEWRAALAWLQLHDPEWKPAVLEISAVPLDFSQLAKMAAEEEETARLEAEKEGDS